MFQWVYSVDFTDGPSGMTVMPAKSIYHPGDEIKCRADSKPSSKYEWINLDRGNVTLGAVFVVSGSMVRQREYRFQCKATNEVGTRKIIKAATLNISFMVQHAGMCDWTLDVIWFYMLFAHMQWDCK